MHKKSRFMFIIMLSALTVSVFLFLQLRKAADAHHGQYGRVDVIGEDVYPGKSLRPVYSVGADLFFFPTALCPAIPESLDGAGNYTNYGIRTMISDDEALYLGTANPMNLLTDPDDEIPEGGWELMKLAP